MAETLEVLETFKQAGKIRDYVVSNFDADDMAEAMGLPNGRAIAWLLSEEQVIVIPKSSSISHVEENCAVLDLPLSKDDLNALDAAFNPPSKRVALEVL